MMGQEEVSVAIVDTGGEGPAKELCAKKDKPTLIIKLKRHAGLWSVQEPAEEPCAKKHAKQASLHQNNKLAKANYSTGPSSYISSSAPEQRRNTVGCTKKRNSDLHRLLFLPDGLQDGTTLSYFVKGKDILKGFKQGDGIFCSHCNTKISPSGFEAHAKYAKKRQAYRHIRTANGHTLHEIALQLFNGQCIESIVQSRSDDKCTLCGVGGELIFCDGCPRQYHAVCLGLEGIPTGDWHCSYCTKNIRPDRRDSSPFILHPDQVVKSPVYQPGGSVVCSAQDVSVDTFDEQKVMQCYQCGKQNLVSCLSNAGLYHKNTPPKDKWFCCCDCERIHSTMQSCHDEVLPASVLDAVNKKRIVKGLTDGAVKSMQFRNLSWKTVENGNLRFLNRAAALFNECFKPIRTKTSQDLIAAMIRGKYIPEQESRQFYCLVLIVDSVVSSAAVLRIISREIAELPFVATSKKFRGIGYFRALFSCIEHLLISMNVQKIVLPAAEHAESMWTNNFGFKKISVERLSKYTRDFQLTMFSETSMLEKVFSETSCNSKVVQATSELAGSSGTTDMEEVKQVAD